MEILEISIASIFCFVAGFIVSSYACYLSNKKGSQTSKEFEKSIREMLAVELALHTHFDLGVSVNKKMLRDMSSEVIGFNLGLHAAGMIINSEPGDRLIVVEKVSDSGEIIYDVEKM